MLRNYESASSGRSLGGGGRDLARVRPGDAHDNEAVILLSKGCKIPAELGDAGGGTVIIMLPTFNIQTPDADGFRRSQSQIAAEGNMAAQRAMRRNK